MVKNYNVVVENDVMEVRDHDLPGIQKKQIITKVTKVYIQVILACSSDKVLVNLCRYCLYIGDRDINDAYPGFKDNLELEPFTKTFVTLNNTLDVLGGRSILGEFYILPKRIELMNGYNCYQVKTFTPGDIIDPFEKDRIGKLCLGR